MKCVMGIIACVVGLVSLIGLIVLRRSTRLQPIWMIHSGGEDEMGIKNDCRKNAEGYSDPTAYEALRNIEQEEDRFHKLLDTIFTLCELSDFHIEERIVIKDKRTGRIWR